LREKDLCITPPIIDSTPRSLEDLVGRFAEAAAIRVTRLRRADHAASRRSDPPLRSVDDDGFEALTPKTAETA
jgi:hypothetical protein